MAKKKPLILDQFKTACAVVSGKIWGLETQAPRIYVWKSASTPYSGWFEFPNADKECLGMPLFCVTIKDCFEQTRMRVEHFGDTIDQFRAFEYALMVYADTLDENKAQKCLDLDEDEIVKQRDKLAKVLKSIPV